MSSFSRRSVGGEAEGFSLGGVVFVPLGALGVGGELAFAAEGIEGFGDVFVEGEEEVAGRLGGGDLGEVGVFVGAGDGAEGADFGGLEAFEGELGLLVGLGRQAGVDVDG